MIAHLVMRPRCLVPTVLMRWLVQWLSFTFLWIGDGRAMTKTQVEDLR